MVIEGNKPTCMRNNVEDEVEEDQRPISPPPPKESKDKRNLVRIGSRFFSKDVVCTKKFQFGIELGKSSSGIRVKSLNEIVSEKERTFKPVNPKTLPACPGGEEVVRPPTPISKEREE